jgi:hypothetical protein
VGRLPRFSFETFAENVVAPNNLALASGETTLDVFAYLTNGGFDCKSQWGPMASNSVDWPTIERDFGALVAGAGGRLRGFETKPQVKISEIVGEGRLSGKVFQDPGQRCAVAQQYWNRYQLHRMLLAAEQSSGFFYDMVLVIREDAYFLEPMRPLSEFNRSAVSVKGCLNFWGLNDKVAVLPRRYATAWLQSFVNHFVNPVHRTASYRNPEHFLLTVAESEGIAIVEAPNAWLPLLDIRDVRTIVSPHGRVRQEGGCFHPIYVGGVAAGYKARRCECVAEGHCDAVVKRLCPSVNVTWGGRPNVRVAQAGRGGLKA